MDCQRVDVLFTNGHEIKTPVFNAEDPDLPEEFKKIELKDIRPTYKGTRTGPRSNSRRSQHGSVRSAILSSDTNR